MTDNQMNDLGTLLDSGDDDSINAMLSGIQDEPDSNIKPTIQKKN